LTPLGKHNQSGLFVLIFTSIYCR